MLCRDRTAKLGSILFFSKQEGEMVEYKSNKLSSVPLHITSLTFLDCKHNIVSNFYVQYNKVAAE